jgi:hypothetical protein
MPKRSSKRGDTKQSNPTAEPPKIPAPNKAKPPRPAKKKDVAAIEQADSEGMAQPQGLPPPPKKKNPAAVALGRLSGEKGGTARAAKLTPAKRKTIAKKAAAKRWGKG